MVFFLFASWLSACGPAAPTVTPVAIRIEYTATARPWLIKAYTCAGSSVIDAQISSADSLGVSQGDMTMRIGEAIKTTLPTYKIGSDSIEVVGNPKNPVQQLDLQQVRDLFTGRIQNWKDLGGADASVEVWVFAAGEDVEQLFEQKGLGGSPVTSLARLAVSPAEMVAAVAQDTNAVGILTQAWKAEGIRNLSTVSTEPVLITVPAPPKGAVLELIHCLQK